MLALEEPFRQTVLRRYFEGLTPAEIAELEGVPAVTIRGRLKRGLDRVRERLDATRRGNRREWLVPLAAFALREVRAVAFGGGLVLGGILVGIKAKLGAAALVIALGFLAWRGIAGPPDRDPPDLRGPERGERAVMAAAGESENSAFATSSFVAPPATAAAVEPMSLTVQVEWSDGRRAAGVMVEVNAWAVGPWHTETHESDEDGRVYLKVHGAGRHRVSVPHGAEKTIDIVPGTEATLVMRIPPGITVEGRVVDWKGRPVERAEVCLTESGNTRHATRVAFTGKEGAFRLDHVQERRSVCARARGYAPSLARTVQPLDDSRKAVTLVLPARGRTLEGSVQDREGNPIPGAYVMAVSEDDYNQRTSFGIAEPPPPQYARSGPDGRFALEFQPTSAVVLSAMGPRHSPWHGYLEFGERSSEELAITLAPGAAVAGCVRDGSGAPAPEVAIRVGSSGDFGSAGTRSGADGNFRLDGLPAGEVTVTASSSELGATTAVVRFHSGTAARWDPVLDAGLVMEGVVFDQNGAPVPGCHVFAQTGDRRFQPLAWANGVRTSEDGRFRLIRCPDKPLEVLVSETHGRTTVEIARLEGVRAGQAPLAIKTVRREPAFAFVQGSVRDHAGTPFGGAIWLWTRDQRSHAASGKADEATGAFKMGPVLPGSYVIIAGGRLHLAEFDVGPNEIRELGSLTLPETGTLRAITNLSPELASAVHCQLWGSSGTSSWTGSLACLLSGVALWPGRYALSWGGPRVIRGWAPECDVRPGEATQSEIKVELGTYVMATLEFPAGFEVPEQVELALFDGRGSGGGGTALRQKDGNHRGSAVLKPGRYHVLVKHGNHYLPSVDPVDVPEADDEVRLTVPLRLPGPK